MHVIIKVGAMIRMWAALMMAVLLSGCVSWLYDGEGQKAIEAQRQVVLDMMKEEPAKRSSDREFESSTPWIAGQSVHKKMAYPVLESTPAELTEKNITLPRLAARLGDLTGINIVLDPDLAKNPEDDDLQVDSGSGQQGAASQGAAGGLGLGALAAQLTQNQSNDRISGLIVRPLSSPIDVAFDTTLKKALDNIASQFSIYWEYDPLANRVAFFRTRTETFQIDFPGEVESEVRVGSSDDQDSVINEEITYENTGGNWEEIKAGINNILSPWGEAEISEATGAVVITDTPDTLKVARKYVDRLNDVFNRQVYLEFRLISVSMRDGSSFQASWNGIIDHVLDQDYVISAATGAGVLPTQGNTLNIIKDQNAAEAALQLLAEKATVSQVTSRSVTTMSNQPAPIRVINDRTFISGINELENTSDAGVTTEVETDTVETGFSATFVPRITDARKLQLQISIELSTLVSLDTVENSIVQTPELDRQTTVQRAWLESGQTLILSGFSRKEDQITLSGSGDPGFIGLGGGMFNEEDNQVLLIMVTPYIQSGDHLE